MMLSPIQKIGLGTVQFGMDYGVTNTAGATPPEEVGKILDFARSKGITTLDTAHLYGRSEEVLGDMLGEDTSFSIITKTPDFSKPNYDSAAAVCAALKNTFQNSLKKLNRRSVYGLMVHNAGGLNGPWGADIYATLQGLKADGLVQKIGASVYTPQDLHEILGRHGSIDIVQVPLNIFDQRMLQDGFLRRLKASGIEIHARSLFLQGSLLAERGRLPSRLSNYGAYFTKYQDYLSAHHLTSLEACLTFGLSLADVDRLIIGINNVAQLREIAAIAERSASAQLDFSELASDNETLINPALWPKAGS